MSTISISGKLSDPSCGSEGANCSLNIKKEGNSLLFSAGMGALSAVVIGSPIGATGGAVFYIISDSISKSIENALFPEGVNLETPPTAQKIYQAAAIHFASLAATWALVNACGMKISFAGAACLSLAPFGIVIGLILGTIAIYGLIIGISNCCLPGRRAN